MKNKWDRLSDEERKEAQINLISFFENERDEKIGVIAANQILNYFLQSIGSRLYNKGIDDSKHAIKNHYEELQYDLDDLLDI